MQTLQVSFANRSGHVLRGIVTLPEGEGPRPFVVHLHGFGGSLSGHKYMYTNMARALAREGIGCARFDFFGCGESDGEFGETTLTGFHHDAEDMCAWAIEQGYADAAHLVLSGQSMGGYVAASVAPAVAPAALVLQCPGAAMWYGAAERADMVTKAGKDSVDLEGLTYAMAFNYDMASHPDPLRGGSGLRGAGADHSRQRRQARVVRELRELPGSLSRLNLSGDGGRRAQLRLPALAQDGGARGGRLHQGKPVRDPSAGQSGDGVRSRADPRETFGRVRPGRRRAA